MQATSATTVNARKPVALPNLVAQANTVIQPLAVVRADARQIPTAEKATSVRKTLARPVVAKISIANQATSVKTRCASSNAAPVANVRPAKFAAAPTPVKNQKHPTQNSPAKWTANVHPVRNVAQMVSATDSPSGSLLQLPLSQHPLY